MSTAWTDGCPVCHYPVAAHEDGLAKLHYERWLRWTAARDVPVFGDGAPVSIGEYDERLGIVHRAARA